MTVSEVGLVRVLGHADGRDSLGRETGVVVQLEVDPPDVRHIDEAASGPLPRGAAYRSAPLLAILDTDAGRLMVIGRCQVTVDLQRTTSIRVLVKELWLAPRSHTLVRRRRVDGRSREVAPRHHHWRIIPGFDGLRDLMAGWLRKKPHAIPADGEAKATTIAKAIAESSRDEVFTLRSMRYELERVIGANLRRLRTQDLEFVLADMVEITVAISRARDEAIDAWRGGLTSWRTAAAAYHAQRRLQDPTLPRRSGARRARRQRWFPILDAGVRQCRAMDQLLAEETTVMHQLLGAAASVSVARDAKAQETFTLVAAVGGALLGLPALILALYGATAVLPINTTNALVLVPIAAAGVVAGLLAAFLPGRARAGKLRRFVITVVATIAIIILLALAGSLVNPRG